MPDHLDLFDKPKTDLLKPPPGSLSTPGDGPPNEYVRRMREARASRAAARGLTVKWSREFGFLELHDPLTGEVHEIATEDAPAWAKWEASRRKTLYRIGRGDAYDLTSAQMAQIWAEEHPVPVDEGIVEDHTADLD
jgi:hypothetical protein